MKIALFILILAIVLLNGCGESKEGSYAENNSSNSSVDANETNASIYCDEANVSNLGELQNSRGYYGENVCFGPFKIVGKWIMAWYVNEPDVIEFRSDGTTLQYDTNGSPDYELSSNYGVSEDGKTLKYFRQIPGGVDGGRDADYNVFEYKETSQEYPNWLKTTWTRTSYIYSIDSQVFDTHWICRIIDDEISSCY